MKSIFILIAFLFSVVCYAAPPPGEAPVVDLLQFTVAPVVNHVVAPEPIVFARYETYCLVLAEAEPNYVNTNCVAAKQIDFVREVSQRPKDSSLNPVISAATIEEYAELTALMSFSNNIDLNKPFSDTSMEKLQIAKNQKFQRNLQNSNYGYPLSGDTKHGNLFFS